MRGQVLSVKEAQYVTAARALGYGNMRILFRHIIPNILAPVIVISAANFASAILIESGLSFLGIGAQPPIPSWGAMIKDHYSYIILGKAYLAIIPGLAIMSLVMAFMASVPLHITNQFMQRLKRMFRYPRETSPIFLQRLPLQKPLQALSSCTKRVKRFTPALTLAGVTIGSIPTTFWSNTSWTTTTSQRWLPATLQSRCGHCVLER